MFEQSMIPKGKRKTGALVFAVLGQIVAVGIILLVPLMFVQALPTAELESMLVAPPPPPPPPPPAAAPSAPHHVAPVRKFNVNELVGPRTIPKQVAVIQDIPANMAEASNDVGGVPGGVPGGVAGGVEGGILGSILDSGPAIAPPPPPPPVKAAAPPTPKIIHVGGNVQAALLISGPKPVYPLIAREARVQGTVELKAIIGKDGRVAKVQVADGNPLLVNAALEAVRKWVYRPTYLNGVPVEVATEIDVTFELG